MDHSSLEIEITTVWVSTVKTELISWIHDKNHSHVESKNLVRSPGGGKFQSQVQKLTEKVFSVDFSCKSDGKDLFRHFSTCSELKKPRKRTFPWFLAQKTTEKIFFMDFRIVRAQKSSECAS